RQRVEGLGVVLESHAVHIEEDLRGEQPPVCCRRRRDGSRRCGTGTPPPSRTGRRARRYRRTTPAVGRPPTRGGPEHAGRAATEAIELALVQREHHLDREEINLGGRVAHLASFRYVSSWASIRRSAAASARSISGAFLTGRMMR